MSLAVEVEGQVPDSIGRGRDTIKPSVAMASPTFVQ